MMMMLARCSRGGKKIILPQGVASYLSSSSFSTCDKEIFTKSGGGAVQGPRSSKIPGSCRLLAQQAMVVRTTREYSTTRRLCNKDDDDDQENNNTKNNSDDVDSSSTSTSMYETINITSMSDKEIEKILEEEEAKMIAEQKEKIVPNWKPGMRKRALQSSYSLEEFEYELEPDKYDARWTLRDKRCGALAIKVGMMPLFDPVWGVRYPCTVLFLDDNVVLGHKTQERHGYTAVQVSAGQRKRKNVGRSVLGQYQSLGISWQESDTEEQRDLHPPYLVREFRVTDEDLLIPTNTRIHASHFVPGQNVDVSGISKGKGFQGAMKRHGFGGMPASHGVSKSHRALGSTGACQDPGKVWKGKKMAGRMGSDRVTVQNLRVVKIDKGRNLLYVHGAVPGNAGLFVEIRDAVKKPLWNTKSVLDEVDRPPLPTAEFDPEIDGSGLSGHEVWMPMPEKDPLAPDADDEAA